MTFRNAWLCRLLPWLILVSRSSGTDGLPDELHQMLDNDDFVTITFDGNHMGYRVTAEVHPDPGSSDVGMARFFFRNGAGTIVIDTPYYWDWREEVSVSPSPPGNVGPAAYYVPHREFAVQERGTEIDIVQPFCFKDVDFDGEREILISTIGYRIYFNEYKIVSENEAKYMARMPQFVYGPDNTETTFDYDRKRIEIVEQSGPGTVRREEYRRRFIVFDPLNPLRRIRNKNESINNIEQYD